MTEMEGFPDSDSANQASEEAQVSDSGVAYDQADLDSLDNHTDALTVVSWLERSRQPQ